MIEPLTIIITARKEGMDATKTVKAVLEQCPSAEIFLVGNLQFPEQPQVANLPSDQTSPISIIPNSNPTIARNAAIRQAQGELIAFIDADCVPAADWLAYLLAPFAEPEVVGVKGTYTTEQRAIVARFVQAEYEQKYRRLEQQAHIDFIDTYSAAYRRDILLVNDAFDETFPFLEDQELSFRLAARGYKMVFAPKAVVYHTHPDTLRAYCTNKFSIGYWKAQVVRRFPHAGVADSHTPQVIKAQIALTGLAGLATLAIGLGVNGWWAIGLFLLLLLTTVPFLTRVQDRSVALAAPFLLTARAVGLGLGYVYGVFRPIANISNTFTTIGGANYVGKRFLDILGGMVGSLITLFLLPFVGLAIKVDSRGPIFFTQERIGQRGRPFTVYKFRSMVTDAEAQLDQLVDIEALAEPVFKLEDDPRVTKIGRILRRWSIDELPQFWNVLLGDMSLIGPRPEETRLVARYSDWHRRRLAVKPGLSGPMQVSGRGDLSLNERVALEIDYIEHYTLWRDIKLILQTFPAIVGGKGAR